MIEEPPNWWDKITELEPFEEEDDEEWDTLPWDGPPYFWTEVPDDYMPA